jgi:hypothetical protein
MGGQNAFPFRPSRQPLAGPKRKGGKVHLVPTDPVLFLDPKWAAPDQATLLSAIRQLTDDAVTQVGQKIFVDGKGNGNRPRGTTLLRSLQNPSRKVTLVQSTSLIPETRTVGSDVNVEVDFSPFHFFTLDAFQFLTRNSGTFSPSYVSQVAAAPLFIVLAHEFSHASRILSGSTVGGNVDNTFCDDSGWRYHETIFREESIVVGLNSEAQSENGIRGEQGLGLRVGVGSPTVSLDKQGVRPEPSAVTGELTPSWWPDYPVAKLKASQSSNPPPSSP